MHLQPHGKGTAPPPVNLPSRKSEFLYGSWTGGSSTEGAAGTSPTEPSPLHAEGGLPIPSTGLASKDSSGLPSSSPPAHSGVSTPWKSIVAAGSGAASTSAHAGDEASGAPPRKPDLAAGPAPPVLSSREFPSLGEEPKPQDEPPKRPRGNPLLPSRLLQDDLSFISFISLIDLFFYFENNACQLVRGATSIGCRTERTEDRTVAAMATIGPDGDRRATEWSVSPWTEVMELSLKSSVSTISFYSFFFFLIGVAGSWGSGALTVTSHSLRVRCRSS